MFSLMHQALFMEFCPTALHLVEGKGSGIHPYWVVVGGTYQ